jgi:ABC-2 type transport system ATP-binding protein
MADIVLDVRDLRKAFGTVVAVDGLSLQVFEGEVYGLLGPNGAGKTTAIRMMAGLLKPDSGEVLIQGVPVKGGSSEAAARVGVCPQDLVFWDKQTCLEQLVFVGTLYDLPPAASRKRSVELLEALGLAEKRNTLASHLSGGMQRRLNLALALVHDPDIAILDEPEAGLDPQSRVMVREYIASLAKRKTVILTTHNMDEADRLADRVAIIDHGRLLALGTPEELRRGSGSGDVLEIRPTEETAGRCLHATENLRLLGLDVSRAGEGLTVRAQGILDRLPAVAESLAAAGIKTQEMRLRQNTLEDVFINLTGRSLRE